MTKTGEVSRPWELCISSHPRNSKSFWRIDRISLGDLARNGKRVELRPWFLQCSLIAHLKTSSPPKWTSCENTQDSGIRPASQREFYRSLGFAPTSKLLPIAITIIGPIYSKPILRTQSACPFACKLFLMRRKMKRLLRWWRFLRKRFSTSTISPWASTPPPKKQWFPESTPSITQPKCRNKAHKWPKQKVQF